MNNKITELQKEISSINLVKAMQAVLYTTAVLCFNTTNAKSNATS